MKKETRMRTIQQTYTVYVSEDGIPFPTEEKCLAYENNVLNRYESIVKSLDQWELKIPFSGWDTEPDCTKMYVLRNENEYSALKKYYIEAYGEDEWYGEAPGSYPTAYIILGREGYVNGWELNCKMMEEWRELYVLTNAVHKKITIEATEAYREK